MKLTCIGKYGPYPKAGESCSCYLLEHAGRHIVIDLGCGALSKLLLLLRIQDIDAIVLSHLHADHMGDVLTLRYALGAAKKLGWKSEPLPIYLPDSPAAEAGLISAHEMVDARYLHDGMYEKICGLDVRFALMPHPAPSYAMAFETDDKKFVYSGDAQDNDKLALFAQGADLFLMEAALLSRDKTDGAGHVSAKDAGRIGCDAGVKRMLLTHIFPEYDVLDILHEARESYSEAEIIEEQKTYEV